MGATYVDVATLGCVPRYTSGHVYYYPVFNLGVDDLRLRADLVHDLNRITGFEAVMRIRCGQCGRAVREVRGVGGWGEGGGVLNML